MKNPQTIAADIDAIDYGDVGVEPEYIDANGHMNVGYYALLFDHALDLPWARLGIGSAMRAAGKASFALEAHFSYKRELLAGMQLTFTFRVLDYDARRIHYYMTMSQAGASATAAVCEQISMCVDLGRRHGADWPDEVLERVATLHQAHARLPRPAEIGRIIGIRRRTA
jgi:acyl-CoA thioester hydrolase